MVAEPDNGERMYRLLQVPPEASAQQIRRAYRRLAHDMHPDTNPEDPEASRRFREITEAYELLSSPERRASYDRQRGPTKAPRPWPTRTDVGVSPVPGAARHAGWVATSGPTFIGAGPVSVGPVPLIAGPVRVTPPRGTTDDHAPATARDIARLLAAIWASRRRL